MKKLFWLFLFIFIALPSYALEVDGDANGYIDIAYGGTNSATAANARTALGVAIGSDVQAYDADLDTLSTSTAWRLFYSNGSSVITQLALGTSGTYLQSNGASAAPTWVTPSGTGDVTGVGDCTSGDCLDGTSDGGTYARIYDGDSHYMQLDVEDISANYTLSLPATIGTSGQLMQSDGDNTTSWVSSLNLAFRNAIAEALWRDSDAAGADDTDEDASAIKANMSTTTEDAEVSDMWFTYHDAGTEQAFTFWDASDWALLLGVMTDATTPAEVAGYEAYAFDFNTSIDGQVLLTPALSTGAGIAIENGAVPATDGYYTGTVRTYTVDSGATQTSFGQAYHVDTDGELIEADGDVASQGAMPAIGLAVETGTGAKKILLTGLICETDWNWTIGGPVYVSDDPSTTEGLTQTVLSTTGDTVQIVGIAVSADCVEINMGGFNWVEVP